MNKPIDREKLIIARGLGGGGMDKKAKGIRRYNVNSHGDVKDNVRTVDITITSYLDRWIVDFLW